MSIKKHYSDFISEEEFHQTVRHFAKVIIGKSPINSERVGSNKSHLTRMIWSRGDLVFSLHHHYVNLTSSAYHDKPLTIDLEQQLNVDWGIILPGEIQINKNDYWSYFKQFIAHEFYIKIADIHDNTANQLEDFGKIISNGRTRITEENDLNFYFSLRNQRDKKATLKHVVSQKILIEAPAYYKLFDRYQDAESLNDYLQDNIKYIKETLSLCKVVEQGFDKKIQENISLDDIQLISDDKLFLVYIYYLYRYSKEKNPTEKATLLPTSEPRSSSTGQQSNDANKGKEEDKVIYCPPQLFALSKAAMNAKDLSVTGFNWIAQQELLRLHQIMKILDEKVLTETAEKGKPTLEENTEAYVKDKVTAIRWALDLSNLPEEESISMTRVENKILQFLSTYIKINTGLTIISVFLILTLGTGTVVLIADILEQSTLEREGLQTQLTKMTEDQTTQVAQKIRKYLIPDSSFFHKYFIDNNDPVLTRIVLNKKQRFLRTGVEIRDPNLSFHLLPESEVSQPIYLVGSKRDSIAFRIVPIGKTYKDMEFIYLVYKYVNDPREKGDPNIYWVDVNVGKIREKTTIRLSNPLFTNALKEKGEPISGTYVVFAVVCPYNWHTQNKVRPEDLKDRISTIKEDGIIKVIINTEGAVHVRGFMAFDIIDPSEN